MIFQSDQTYFFSMIRFKCWSYAEQLLYKAWSVQTSYESINARCQCVEESAAFISCDQLVWVVLFFLFFFFAEYILRISSSIGGWFCWHLPTTISSKFAKQVTQKSQIVGQMLIIVTVSKSIMFSNVIVAFSRSHIEVPADLSDERGLAVRPLDIFVIVKSLRLKLFCVGRIAWLVAS